MDTEFLFPALATAALIYWIYEHPNSGNTSTPESRIVQDTAQSLKNDLLIIMDRYYQKYLYPHSPPSIKFVIPSSHSATYHHETIHILIQDLEDGSLFDYNTLLQVGVHECSHALCVSTEGGDHGPAFTEVLQRLNQIGEELQLFDSQRPIPSRYKKLCS